ncbi:unnamed protein product [Hyaloperonospora brassicae]|uniref:Uncharacterized protein n=1 Tax=Hyaloperonospora brassicae TaxID=162125 RepID=A0AAV0U7U6_HYABA|nr:unnamed protein product [Hyaloperonospora brassicae]
MFASLSEALAWPPRGSRPQPLKQQRTPTATCSDSSDDVSDRESAPVAAAPKPTTTVYAIASKLFVAATAPRDDETPTTPTADTADTAAKSDEAAAVGTHVSTAFGLGTVAAVRHDDGVVAVDLPLAGLLYLTSAAQMQVVPALLGDHVRTRVGAGRIVQYNAEQAVYVLQRGGGNGDEETKEKVTPKMMKEDDDEAVLFCVPVSDVILPDGRTFGRLREPVQRARSLSEGSTSSEDCGLRRTRPRLSSTSSSNGLTLLKSIATTSYSFIASKYHQGQPVITRFGAGHIVAVDPQRGSAQIYLVWGAMAFLNADMIDFYPKALEGTDVHTKFGSGIVLELRPADAIYTVRLHDVQPLGKSDVVFVHESDLSRSRKIAVTAANVRDRLKAMAHRCFGERIVVAHQSHDAEPNSAGI